MVMSVTQCSHAKVTCLNSYELIRKYRCDHCGAVMMCSCDEAFGHRFLPHQLDEGSILQTQQRVRVTDGFQPSICNTCRGQPEESHPKAAMRGYTTKIKRYYWREIYMETTQRFADWMAAEAVESRDSGSKEAQARRDEIEREVVEELKALHARTPKYVYADEPSQDRVLAECAVEIVSLCAPHVSTPSGMRIQQDGRLLHVEEHVADVLRRQGFDVLFSESRPWHVLFGVFMWMVVEDLADPLAKMVWFGERTAFDEGRPSESIGMRKPDDFGSSGYGKRRALAIAKHLDWVFAPDADTFWTFDYWYGHSERLRQYLWAHRQQDAVTARRILEVLPARVLRRVLEYLAEGYWERYLGWPDLLAIRGDEFFFAEVKSSKDRLSNDQKRWIGDNAIRLQLPFKLIKVHRPSNKGAKKVVTPDCAEGTPNGT